MLLKQGDTVRLLEAMDLYQNIANVNLPKGTKGKIMNVDERGYTVEFEGDLTPVTGLTDADIELDLDGDVGLSSG